MSIIDAKILRLPKLLFDPAIPSRNETRPYQGILKYGPFDISRVDIPDHAILFVFPESLRASARKLVLALRDGHQAFPGFSRMFSGSIYE
jgi:hypothetical protein